MNSCCISHGVKMVLRCPLFTFKNGGARCAFSYFKRGTILKSNVIQQVRHNHVAFNIRGCHSLKKHELRKSLSCMRCGSQGMLGVRLASTTTSEPITLVTSTLDLGTNVPSLARIPDIPAIPPEGDVGDIIQVGGEPTFESLGLGGWSPVGMVQNCMEYLHIGLDLPWWQSIIVGTIVVRVIIFPLVIVAQRNAAKMNNYLPQLQILQLRMTEARQSGNQLEAARYSQEMMLFMKEKQLNPFKNMLVPLAQAPLFISFFMSLRGMANVPVESMRTGGLFWFEDLTLQDQYYILPIITSFTMWVTIEVGTDSAKLSASNMQTMKYVLRALPICILPFTISFPGAILCYWVSTNFISLIQVGILRIPSVREFFKIEPLVTHNQDTLPVKSKGFVAGIKESWTNMKISKELEDRQRFDEMQFQRAGSGPIQKTYKFDPTQPRDVKNKIQK